MNKTPALINPEILKWVQDIKKKMKVINKNG